MYVGSNGQPMQHVTVQRLGLPMSLISRCLVLVPQVLLMLLSQAQLMVVLTCPSGDLCAVQARAISRLCSASPDTLALCASASIAAASASRAASSSSAPAHRRATTRRFGSRTKLHFQLQHKMTSRVGTGSVCTQHAQQSRHRELLHNSLAPRAIQYQTGQGSFCMSQLCPELIDITHSHCSC